MKNNTITKKQREKIKTLADICAQNMAAEKARGVNAAAMVTQFYDKVHAFYMAAADLYLLEWRDAYKMESEIAGYMGVQYKNYCAEYCLDTEAA